MKRLSWNMNDCLRTILLMLFSLQFVNGQQIAGIVRDRATDLSLEKVTVLNKTTGQQTHTNAKGEFKIQASRNQLLIFYEPGYLKDTLLLIDSKPIRRYLVTENNMLK